MELTHLLLVCHVYVLLLARKEILSFEQGTLNWFSAQQKCKAQNSILRTESLKQINATGTFNFWRGLYTRYSAWIKTVGCYADNATEAYSTFFEMQELSTSVGFCQEICISDNFLIFAVKGSLCRCLGKLPTEDQLVPSFCNTTCSQPGTRNYEPYFNECGGNGTYSVYISGTQDERKPNLPGIFCVAMQCSTTNSSFNFEESCSKSYPQVCQNEVGISNPGTWSEAMEICKSMPQSSYLQGEVFLNDINKSCNLISRNISEKSWIGVANEVYFGNDRGISIDGEEKDLFHQCQLCSYINSSFKDCKFVECEQTENISLICVQVDQDQKRESSGLTAVIPTSTVNFSRENSKLTQFLTTQTTKQATERSSTGKPNTPTESMMDPDKNNDSSSEPTDMVRTSILVLKAETTEPTSHSTQSSIIETMKETSERLSTGKPITTTESKTIYSLGYTSDNIETITPISTWESTTLKENHSNENDEASKATVSISIAAVIGGICLFIFFSYLCFRKKRKRTGLPKKKFIHGQNKDSNVGGIVNAAYFTIELKEQGINSSDMEEKIENPNIKLEIKAEEETYHHLRERDSGENKYSNECNYDTTKNAIEKTEKYNQNMEETYDRLGDNRCNTIADDTYHHACTVKKDRSDYDVTEVRKQYVLDSPYNHVEIVPNENDIEQDTISDLSETQNEDHTYFILEQD